MNLMLWLYLVDVAGSLKNYFIGGVIVSLIFFIICMCMGAAMSDNRNSTDKDWKLWRTCLYGIIATFLISSFTSLALPNNKTLYLMMGAKTAEEIVNNPAVQRIGARVMDIVDEKLNELSPPKKEKSNETK